MFWLHFSPVSKPTSEQAAIDYARRHFRFGWWCLFGFTMFGLVLEAFHGFKLPAYLDASNETRRLMWTLAHAHGTLLSLINITFAICLRVFQGLDTQFQRTASWCLIAATLLLPSGFFLGGITTYGGDPSLGILLVPVGAAFLLVGIHALTRWEASTVAKSQPSAEAPKQHHKL